MESSKRWSENPDDGRDCHQCGQGIADFGWPIPQLLSFDEKIEKIQRYLPKILAGKILSQEKAPISIEKTSSNVKFSVSNSMAEIEMIKGYGGNPINLAFRIEKKARPGEILITEGVKTNLGNPIQIASQWNESLKGIGRTAIYRLIGMKET